MIDDDETDWKIVAIDAEDRWAPELNDIDDVERLVPGTVSLIREWFRTASGKPVLVPFLLEIASGIVFRRPHDVPDKRQAPRNPGFQVPDVQDP